MTTLYLGSIPQLDRNYNHVMNFDNATQRRNYVVGKCQEQKSQNIQNHPSLTSVTIPIPPQDGYLYDYLMIQGKYVSDDLFFFITNFEQASPSSTTFHLELDVWMTYHLKMNIESAFVERCHVDRWKANGFPTTETTPEGIEGNYELKERTPTNANPRDGLYIYYSGTPLGETKTGGGGGGGGSLPSPSNTDTTDEDGNGWFFPVDGIISATHPNYPDGSYHGALDIAGNVSEPIYPPKAGMTVYQVGYAPTSYGNYVILYDSDSETRHYLAHMMSAPLVSQGQTVYHDTILGNVGSSGNSTGPHLHWEIRTKRSNYTYGSSIHPSVGTQVGDTVKRGVNP